MNLKEQCIAYCIPIHKKKRVMKRRLARMFYHKFKCFIISLNAIKIIEIGMAEFFMKSI